PPERTQPARELVTVEIGEVDGEEGGIEPGRDGDVERRRGIVREMHAMTDRFEQQLHALGGVDVPIDDEERTRTHGAHRLDRPRACPPSLIRTERYAVAGADVQYRHDPGPGTR